MRGTSLPLAFWSIGKRMSGVALPFCSIRLIGRKPLPAAYPQQLKTPGDHLRKRRLDLGILQKDVAQQIGVSKATITNWESDHNFPELRFIPAIIEFLDYWPYDTPTDNLGQQIVAKRTRQRLSQKELARLLGVDPSTLRRWEGSRGQPLMKHRVRVMAFLSGQVLDEYGF